MELTIGSGHGLTASTTTHTPTGATYDPNTGLMVVTIIIMDVSMEIKLNLLMVQLHSVVLIVVVVMSHILVLLTTSVADG